jgi:hypothetical protein
MAYMPNISGELPRSLRVYKRSAVLAMMEAYAASREQVPPADVSSSLSHLKALPRDGVAPNLSAASGALKSEAARSIENPDDPETWRGIEETYASREQVPPIATVSCPTCGSTNIKVR